MNAADLLTATAMQLQEQFRAAAKAHATAISTGRHRVANRNYDAIRDIALELRERAERTEVFTALRADADEAVRLAAARYSLDFATVEAEQVLQSIAEGQPSVVQLDAEMTLKEWKRGALDITS